MSSLTGLRVIDLSQGIAGPQCTKHLADAGAMVAKVEPLAGDVARRWQTPGTLSSASFSALNRNKMSIALDVSHARGRAVLDDLVSQADVFVLDETDMRARNLGIDQERLRGVNPKLVYGSITPFGDKGPYSGMAGSELVVQAMVDYVRCLGTEGEEPVRLGLDVAQMTAAIFAFQAIVAALVQRFRTAAGQYVTTSWLGAMTHIHGLTWAAFTNPDRWGGQHHDLYTDPPRYCYRVKDGEIYFTPGRMTQRDWEHLCHELDMQAVLDEHPRFAANWRETIGIGLLATEFRSVWESILQTRTRVELVDLLQRVGANAVPVNTLQDLAAEPQVAAVGMIETNYGGREVVPTTGIPWTLSATPSKNTTAAPHLGEHTLRILRDVGYDSATIGELLRAGVIVDGASS